MEFNFKNFFLDHLPGPLNKLDKNFKKLAAYFNYEFNLLVYLFNQIEKMRSLDDAKGKVLDEIGDNYNQPRGEADDEFYRIMIRSKRALNSGKTTVNGLLDIISQSLNVKPDGIVIEPLRSYKHSKEDIGEPLAISIKNIPLQWIDKEWEQNYIINRIRDGVAAGIRVDEISFIDKSDSVLSIRGISSSTLIYKVYENYENKEGA
ncbi:hypothetical protein IV73_GL000185 [Weissella kandleri]|uniref:Uncharacterized protein n=1 Tax=Weissella kandleri TaxID=1616 RepID=A0A0R2JEC6_9LACO|nr:hypothetical protein [Weissella kandleri]KRN75691.1 hypothetical protein IV73_GL000185 [Weissella kandleri]